MFTIKVAVKRKSHFPNEAAKEKGINPDEFDEFFVEHKYQKWESHHPGVIHYDLWQLNKLLFFKHSLKNLVFSLLRKMPLPKSLPKF